jgi:CrcB protein
MDKVLLVFIGGGAGSVCRFWLASWLGDRFGPIFPFGTLAVNLIGCFLIGLIAGLPSASASVPPFARLLLMTGFLGGLTTFSTYEYESFLLLSQGDIAKALLNLGGSMVLGLLALLVGVVVVRLACQGLKGGL